MSHANDAFFVVVVDLDFPSIDVSLNKCLQIKFWIGADEESGFAVEELRSFAQAVSQRFDDNEKQRFIGSGFAPEHGTEGFDLEVTDLSDGKTRDFLKGDLVIVQDFLWCWGFEAVLAWTPVCFCVWVQRQAQVGVLADAPDECGSGRQCFQENLIGIAAINADEELAQQGIGALIEGIAKIDDRGESDLSEGVGFPKHSFWV